MTSLVWFPSHRVGHKSNQIVASVQSLHLFKSISLFCIFKCYIFISLFNSHVSVISYDSPSLLGGRIYEWILYFFNVEMTKLLFILYIHLISKYVNQAYATLTFHKEHAVYPKSLHTLISISFVLLIIFFTSVWMTNIP